MIYIILVFFVIFLVVSFLRNRYNNPYLLTYVFGLKGAGKSTFMVKRMIYDLKHGWTVYTNMSDVCIPGVRIFDVSRMSTCKFPPRSSIYIDEAGLIWDNRDFKSFNKGYTEFFKFQRKYHNKVTVNSQAFDVDKKIRDLIDRMYLMTPVLGCIAIARPIKRTIKVVEATGNSESKLAMNLEFMGFTSFRLFWMPTYWPCFNSFEAPERPDVPFGVSEPSVKPSRLLKRLERNLVRSGVISENTDEADTEYTASADIEQNSK